MVMLISDVRVVVGSQVVLMFMTMGMPEVGHMIMLMIVIVMLVVEVQVGMFDLRMRMRMKF